MSPFGFVKRFNINHFEATICIVIYHHVTYYFVIFSTPKKQIEELMYIFNHCLVYTWTHRNINSLRGY